MHRRLYIAYSTMNTNYIRNEEKTREIFVQGGKNRQNVVGKLPQIMK